METSLYDLLMVTTESTQEEIKKSYRRLSMEHHPDKGGDPAVFQQIAEAYKILSDPEKRLKYDNGEPLQGILQGVQAFDREVLNVALTTFISAVEACHQTHSQDIMEIIKQVISNGIHKALIEINMHKKKLEKYESVKKRIKKKSDGDNIFVSSLTSMIQQVTAQIAGSDRAIKVMEAALKLMEDYDYDLDKIQRLSGATSDLYVGPGGIRFTFGGL